MNLKLIYALFSLIMGILMLYLAKPLSFVHWILFLSILSFSIKLIYEVYKKK